MEEREVVMEEKLPKARGGMGMLVLGLLLILASIGIFVAGCMLVNGQMTALGVVLIILAVVYWLLCWIPFAGLKIIKPNEALVLTLFGKYYGTLKMPGFYYVNPFCTGVNPAVRELTVNPDMPQAAVNPVTGAKNARTKDSASGKKISLKAITHDNGKQKINDQLGNPIDVGIVIIWRVVNTAKAVFNVDDYRDYLSIQADSALRNTVRLYPYDVADGGDDSDPGQTSLRGSSQEVANRIKEELQKKVEVAGLEIMETRITHLAYSPEIAAAMLQRQQAAAIIDARKMIVDGAVGMVEMALEKLNEGGIVELDEERKAAMVSNLLVVLCGNRDAQPIVNSGSIY